MTRKINSFTLSELLVTMIIALIVVGLAFEVLNLVKKQFTGVQKKYENTEQLALFKERIWLDFNRHSQISYDSAKLSLTLKSDTDSVFYDFLNESVIRDKDTLKLPVKIKRAFFQGEEVTAGLVDAVSFDTGNEKTAAHLFVFKRNDTTLFMNQTWPLN
ncbi:PulJ/GspJ family protein [Flavobacterium pallidum]|uniref:Type II secretion system protein n=1 Tax=Flavobacterium pallidum TaxID=2172098 RepID=A0A2S1SG10_9FLAO|nr:hypothetical protein [Flavobacterium pallidum]AWI25277.1 hypothetical protein HYN49_04845 [Flavobacterium pallidum]